MSKSISTTDRQIVALYHAIDYTLRNNKNLTTKERNDMVDYAAKLLKVGGKLLKIGDNLVASGASVAQTPAEPPPPQVVLSAITLTPSSVSVPVNVEAGSVLASLSAVPAGASRSISPADGRVVLNAAKTAVLRGGSAASPGTTNYVVTDTLAGATNSPQMASLELTFASVVVEPNPVEPTPADPLPTGDPMASYTYTAYERPVIGSGVAGVVYAPQMQIRSAAGEVQGFAFNAGSAPLAASYGVFALRIEPGLLKSGDFIEYVPEGGAAVPAQMQVLKTDANGWAVHIRIACMRPALAANQTIRAMLRKAAAAPTGAVISHAGLSSTITGSLTVHTRHQRDDASQAAVNTTHDIGVAAMLAATPGTYWMQGPLCTERRYEKRITDAIRVIVDVRRYPDGTHDVDYQPAFDLNCWPNPNDWRAWTVSISLAQGGTSVYSVSNKKACIAQVDRKLLRSAASAAVNAARNPADHNIQVDAPLWSQLGVWPTYNYQLGVSESVLDTYAQDMANDADWRGFLPNNSVQKQITGTGERPDIGIVPGWHATWIMTQSAVARDRMLGVGEAAMLYNYYDANKNQTLSMYEEVGGYPALHIDYRAENAGLNVTVSDGQSGWEVDGGHQPITPYVPYLVTGDRFFADRLEAHVNFQLAFVYSRSHGAPKPYVFLQNNQPREAGWNARDAAMGVIGLPDSSPFPAVFMKAIDMSFDVVLARKDTWQSIQGEPFGWLPNCNPDDDGVKPWMHDHVAAGTAMCYIAGSTKARDFMDWMANWQVGRFFADDKGFSYKSACAYYIGIGNSHVITETPPTADSWAEYEAVADEGTVNGFDGAGNTNKLGLRTLSLYATLRKETRAAGMIARYIAEGAPYTDDDNYRGDPIDSIRPLVWKA